jgi:hypothetical protein
MFYVVKTAQFNDSRALWNQSFQHQQQSWEVRESASVLANNACTETQHRTESYGKLTGNWQPSGEIHEKN